MITTSGKTVSVRTLAEKAIFWIERFKDGNVFMQYDPIQPEYMSAALGGLQNTTTGAGPVFRV